jgi:hypothetical protein
VTDGVLERRDGATAMAGDGPRLVREGLSSVRPSALTKLRPPLSSNSSSSPRCQSTAKWTAVEKACSSPVNSRHHRDAYVFPRGSILLSAGHQRVDCGNSSRNYVEARVTVHDTNTLGPQFLYSL